MRIIHLFTLSSILFLSNTAYAEKKPAGAFFKDHLVGSSYFACRDRSDLKETVSSLNTTEDEFCLCVATHMGIAFEQSGLVHTVNNLEHKLNKGEITLQQFSNEVDKELHNKQGEHTAKAYKDCTNAFLN